MQLTRHTDYGLRVLIFLGLQPGEQLVTMAQVERHFDIPHNHLIKVVQRLAARGYVHTVRGKGGGLRLAREAAAIRLGDVVRDMETRLELVDCHKPVCPLQGRCRLKGMLNEAQRAFLDTLNRHTLEEITAGRRDIAAALDWMPDAIPDKGAH